VPSIKITQDQQGALSCCQARNPDLTEWPLLT
jgi:hypothetical protein